MLPTRALHTRASHECVATEKICGLFDEPGAQRGSRGDTVSTGGFETGTRAGGEGDRRETSLSSETEGRDT